MVPGPPRDRRRRTRPLGPFDGVVHLAGAGIGDRRWSAARKKVILESRTDSTRLLVETLLAAVARPRRCWSAPRPSASTASGATRSSPRSRRPGSGFLAEVCRAWEAATRPAQDAGIRTVLLRTGIVLSRHGGAWGKQLPLFRLGLGGRMGSGAQYRSWITLEDEIGVVLHCLADDGLAGPVNATAPEPATDAEVAHAIGAVLHRPTVMVVPATALRLVLGAEMADRARARGAAGPAPRHWSRGASPSPTPHPGRGGPLGAGTDRLITWPAVTLSTDVGGPDDPAGGRQVDRSSRSRRGLTGLDGADGRLDG